LLQQERLLFSGDHIMEGSTVVIRPPDGDMAEYLQSLERLRTMRLRAIAPGHGHLITDPAAKIDEYVTHRLERQAQVLGSVRAGATEIPVIVEQLYPDLDEELVPMAHHTVHAHLLKLAAEGLVRGAEADGVWKAA
jgi:glyoxylase-like metal-dependent hydrolase (beta-lactamase superfamily II)